ncbi:MAG: DUF5591 domain-containing protein, partial [Candidatus Jordarchaeaceae archaeon]
EVLKIIKSFPEEQQRRFQIMTKSTIFGLIPLELEEVYPLAQHVNLKPDPTTIQHTSKVITRYLATHNYRKVIIQVIPEEEESFEPIRKICQEKNIDLQVIKIDETSSLKNNLKTLEETLRKVTLCDK